MKGERRSTIKITLRIRPSVVEELKEMADRWEVTLSDVVAAGVGFLAFDLVQAQVSASTMRDIRLAETGHKAFPRKKAQSKKRRKR